MTVSGGLRIERKPSIESEPRTLSLAELRSAREEVMLILNTKTSEEAINIFTERLEPVRSIKDVDNMDVEEEDYINLPDGFRRDIVTAPF